MDIAPADPLVAHLRRCCLRVMGERPGCGFFVAPQLLITCAHVVGDEVPVGSRLELSPWGAGGAAAGVEGAQSSLPPRAEVLAIDAADDLALLKLVAGDYPHVALDGEVRLGDPLVAIGFPQEGQRLELDQFTAEFEAEVPFAEASGQGPAGVELKFKGGQVRHGFSGGPLLNRRTWRVIGVVAVTLDARSPRGGFAKPLACIESLLAKAGQARPRLDSRWTDAEVRQRQPAEGAVPAFSPEQLLQLRQVLRGPDSPGLQERIEALSTELGKDRFAIRLALRQLGAASEEIPDEQLGRRLLESTESFERVARAALPDLEDPRITQTFQRGQEALRAEDPDPQAADACFEQVADLALAQARQAEALEAQAAAARERSQSVAAEAVAQRAQLALARFAYRQAAVWFAEAAQLLPAARLEQALAFREEATSALYKQGLELGDNAALREAVVAYRDALKERTRERVPLDWATTQNKLGNALSVLGERESGTWRLEEAVEAYRDALKERTHERVPLDWATTQNNLGTALRALGERESGTWRLEEAVEAYRDALKELTHERVPLDWAMTQNNLGTALSVLGEREIGTRRLEEAVEAYRDALKELTHERVPLEWAMTQNNLGNALRALGEREIGTGRLEEAVEAYRDALKEYTRERVPLDWATTQNNLGNALRALGERESGTGRLEEAVEAYRDALKEYTRERVPLQWATTQNNLGNALRALGERESGTGRLEEAVAACRDALKELTHERVPLDWAKTQNNLGNALSVLGERESGTGRLEEAVQAYRDAREAFLGAWSVFREAEDSRFDVYFSNRLESITQLLGEPPPEP